MLRIFSQININNYAMQRKLGSKKTTTWYNGTDGKYQKMQMVCGDREQTNACLKGWEWELTNRYTDPWADMFTVPLLHTYNQQTAHAQYACLTIDQFHLSRPTARTPPAHLPNVLLLWLSSRISCALAHTSLSEPSHSELYHALSVYWNASSSSGLLEVRVKCSHLQNAVPSIPYQQELLLAVESHLLIYPASVIWFPGSHQPAYTDSSLTKRLEVLLLGWLVV